MISTGVTELRAPGRWAGRNNGETLQWLLFQPLEPHRMMDENKPPPPKCEFGRCGGKGGRRVNRPWGARARVTVEGTTHLVCEHCANLLVRQAKQQEKKVKWKVVNSEEKLVKLAARRRADPSPAPKPELAKLRSRGADVDIDRAQGARPGRQSGN